MVYGQVLEFSFLHGSLQRAWQEVSLNFELKVLMRQGWLVPRPGVVSYLQDIKMYPYEHQY
ncbi:unnamed protein product [Tetraodon nigroviridis]|uniref:(spotted green pufferfish) hypothetical protein n=1 Tax=Tetraodon nigroviridis TaxID=99883 RepID=Q4S3W5_TETNG|nr:unnamed protein product [Tetraodon nigroviridis]